MNYEMIMDRVLELRKAADDAEARLFAFLYEVQNTPAMLKTIEEAGHNFHDWVKNDVLIHNGRYDRFADGFKKLGADVDIAVEIGVQATQAATKIRSKSKASEYVAAVRAWREGSRGNRPSENTAKKIVSQIDPRAEVPRAVQRQTRIQELEAECSKLRAENRELRAEIRSLKAATKAPKRTARKTAKAA
jgi:hypothetical protein